MAALSGHNASDWQGQMQGCVQLQGTLIRLPLGQAFLLGVLGWLHGTKPAPKPDVSAGRYVWLPLWVLPLPASEPGPPVDVVVRWHDSWHVTDFERAPRPRKVHAPWGFSC